MSTLLSWTLANAAMACVLGLLAWGSKRWLRRPALTHALWVLVLLKLVTPPLATFAVPFPASESEAPQEIAVAATPLAEAPALPVLPPAPFDLALPRMPDADAEAATPEAIAPPLAPAPPVAAAAPIVPLAESRAVPTTTTWLLPTLGWFWLAGTMLWFTVAMARLVRFQRLLRLAEPAPEAMRLQAAELAQRMDVGCPDVVVVPGTISPMLWVRRQQAKLVLPVSLLARLSTEQWTTILAHELAHWRRGDHWVRRLEMLVLGLYWWNPLVWIARRQLQEAEEECCDAWVVATLPEAARDYALALVETLDFLAGVPAALPLGASGVGQLPSLQRRLAMILSKRPERSLTVLGGMVLAAAVLALLPWIPTWAQDGERPEKKRPPEEKKKDGPDFKREKPNPDRERIEDELRKAREELERAQQRFQEKMRELNAGKGGPDRPFPPGGPDRPMPPGKPKEGERPFPPPGGHKEPDRHMPPGGPLGGPRGDLEKRLNDVERKLDAVLWELGNLRKEMGPRPFPPGGEKRKPGDQPPGEPKRRVEGEQPPPPPGEPRRRVEGEQPPLPPGEPRRFERREGDNPPPPRRNNDND